MPHPFTLEHVLRVIQPAVRVPLHLSPDGRRLALCTQPASGRGQAVDSAGFTVEGVPVEMVGSHVLVIEVTDGEITAPFPESSTSWGPRWSPDGRWLAAYVCHGGPPCLALWSIEHQTVRWCRQAVVRPFFGFEIPQWTPDSQVVVLKLAQTDSPAQLPEGQASAEEAAVMVFSFDPLHATTLPQVPAFAEERGKGNIGWVDVQTGTVRRLATAWTFQGWRVAPDGRAVAVLKLADSDMTRQQFSYDLMVLPAVDKLVELGIANPGRLGLWGHSYGGYTVLALLTQTMRFRAAVASAPWGINLTSMYGTLSDAGDSFHLGWCETGQARLAGTPWEKRDAYIENSPLFYLDRVQTPLLLVCGTGDTGATDQAGEAFSALRRLGQRVDLLRYRDEAHWPGVWSELNVRDLATRVLAWYTRYLQAAPPPTGAV